MTSIAERRLDYMYEKRTDSWIAQNTGIPRSTIGFVRRGERALPSQYDYQLRLGFQREAYKRHRDAGMNFSEARRYSAYSPESAGLKTAIMKDIVNQNTMGGCIQEKLRLEKEGIFVEIDDLWAGMKGDIIDAYQHSDKTLDEWEKDLT